MQSQDKPQTNQPPRKDAPPEINEDQKEKKSDDKSKESDDQRGKFGDRSNK